VIQGKAGYLLTGGVRHFDHLCRNRIAGVMVVRPVKHFERRHRG